MKSALVALFVVFVAAVSNVHGAQGSQGPPGQGAQPARSPKDAAPIDLTGYWVSVVTEDWRWRMVTPIKGDFASVPIARPRRDRERLESGRDESDGNQCRAYGAAAISVCQAGCASRGRTTTR